MRILLTNDDGITSDGLWAAARGLARVGDLTIIGTADDWSNGSASIRHTIGSKLRRFTDLPADLPPGVDAYSIEAPPAGAIITGLMTGLFEPFDLVASGANYGVNIGGDLIRSGTFGAALTGFERGVTAFAISVARGARDNLPQRWDGVTDVSERIARWLIGRSGPPTLLNVNLPNRSFAEMAGARIVRPAGWSNLDRARLGTQPEADGSWTVTAWFDLQRPFEDDEDTDAGAVLAGLIAISHVTPMGRVAEPAPDDLEELVETLAPGGSVPSYHLDSGGRGGDDDRDHATAGRLRAYGHGRPAHRGSRIRGTRLPRRGARRDRRPGLRRDGYARRRHPGRDRRRTGRGDDQGFQTGQPRCAADRDDL